MKRKRRHSVYKFTPIPQIALPYLIFIFFSSRPFSVYNTYQQVFEEVSKQNNENKIKISSRPKSVMLKLMIKTQKKGKEGNSKKSETKRKKPPSASNVIFHEINLTLILILTLCIFVVIIIPNINRINSGWSILAISPPLFSLNRILSMTQKLITPFLGLLNNLLFKGPLNEALVRHPCLSIDVLVVILLVMLPHMFHSCIPATGS